MPSTFQMASNVDLRLKLNSDELSLLGDFKRWVETDIDFYGRSEDEFLALFLRSCNFDLDLSKKTFHLYYSTRFKYPEWWKNRDLNLPGMQYLIKQRFASVLIDHVDGNCPTVLLIHVSHLGPSASINGPAGMYYSCGIDLTAYRKNCQLNGAIIIFDLSDYYLWMLWKILWPPFIKDLINAFLLCAPIQMKSVVLVNAPAITSTMVNIIRSFLPQELKNKVQCCKSWDDIGMCVPLEALPVECGGHAGTLKEHEDAFFKEFLAMNDYFLDDNKYGFKVNKK